MGLAEERYRGSRAVDSAGEAVTSAKGPDGAAGVSGRFADSCIHGLNGEGACRGLHVVSRRTNPGFGG